MNSLVLNQKKIRELGCSPIPEALLRHPGMVSDAERRALFGLAQICWRPGSTIIDAGAFLGASTKIFCEALALSDAARGAIYSYEYGVFNDYNAQVAAKLTGRPFAAGDGFGDFLQSLIDDRRGSVRHHIGDIRDYPYDGGPVSIAFFDILKSASLTDFVYSNFFPKFDTDTLLYQQDYFHPGHPWIACSMAKYADAFAYVGQPEPERGAFNSAVFVVRESTRIPKRVDEFQFMPRDEALRLLDAAIDMHADPVERLCVIGQRAAAEAAFDGDEASAAESFRRLLADHGLAALGEDRGQRHHVNRILNAIKNFASKAMAWG